MVRSTVIAYISDRVAWWRSASLPLFPPQQQHGQIHSNSIYIGQSCLVKISIVPATTTASTDAPEQASMCPGLVKQHPSPLSTASGWTGPRAGQRDRLWMYLEPVIHCLQFSCCPFFLCTKLTSCCLQYSTQHQYYKFTVSCILYLHGYKFHKPGKVYLRCLWYVFHSLLQIWNRKKGKISPSPEAAHAYISSIVSTIGPVLSPMQTNANFLWKLGGAHENYHEQKHKNEHGLRLRRTILMYIYKYVHDMDM